MPINTPRLCLVILLCVSINDPNRPQRMSMAPSKRGLCWPADNRDPVFTFTKPGSKVSWLYNWSPDPTAGASSLEFVPMQWNGVEVERLGDRARAAGARAVLAFNEPELPEQANMSAEAAAGAWLRGVEPLRRAGLRAGSPGISAAGHAVPWLLDFLARIRAAGGDVDFLCLHWYGETAGQFFDYLWSTFYRLGGPEGGKPVWITEFAPTNWNVEAPLPREHVEGFARETCRYLDGLEWVERYAWFGPMRDVGTVGKWARMLDDAGRLTEVGKIWRDG